MQMLSTAILLLLLCSLRSSVGQNDATFSVFVSRSSTLNTASQVEDAVGNSSLVAAVEGLTGISSSGLFDTMVNKQMTL